ncbi:MAG: hypothetical protein JNJ47_00255 [Alphaproteobacteria bacterium]|nr:hypothetical protein [Alphaproteobacteria bacterium]
MTKLQLLITGAAALCLSGCMGVYEGGFECPVGEGVGCKSISEVNHMVNEGDLPLKAASNPPQTSCKQCGSNLDPQQSNIDPLQESRIWYSPWALGEV